jgi:hypothetical protein
MVVRRKGARRPGDRRSIASGVELIHWISNREFLIARV